MPDDIQRRAGRKTRPPSLLEKVTAYQAVIRDLSLTLHEWALLTQVVDSTIGWGVTHKELTLDDLTTRCKISTRSVRRARAGLVKRGLIKVLFTGRTNRYGVTEDMGGLLKIPKRLKADAAQPGQWGRSARPEASGSYKNKPPRTDEPVREPVTPSIDGARRLAPPHVSDLPDKAEENVEHSRVRTRKRRAKQITRYTHAAAWITWEMAHAECGMGKPVGWGGKVTSAQVKKFLDAFPDKTASELHGFLNWVVYEWRGAVKKELSWVKDFPSMPVVGLMLSQIERLVVCWRGGGVKVGEEWRAGPHAKEIKRLLLSGKSKRAKELMRDT